MSVESLPPLAEAKLLAPRLRPELVPRPRIQSSLAAGRDATLTLVAAPPGFGKTTAVRSWCASGGSALAWVSLDASDNDPFRLWRYAATAVDRVREGLGRNALRRLGAAGGSIEDPVIELMNGIAAYGDELTIVLDDFQSVTDAECLESVGYALENLPPTARLVLLTRVDPVLRLPQLRANGMLAELRTKELAFTVDEARELLVERGGLALGPAEVEILWARTEGWPGALYLALLWLRGVADPPSAVRAFGGDHLFVADYLNQEVVSSLDEESRWFLLRASVLGRFTAGLLDGVFGRSDAAAVLGRLERTNLLIGRLEQGGWYRVHPLLGEFAGFQLAAREPGAAAAIHRRAAVWFHERGLAVEAIEHASAAGDGELVADLLVEHHLRLIRGGDARTLLRWTRTLSEEQLVRFPELPMAAATATAILGRGRIEQRRLLEVAGRARIEHPGRYSAYVEAGIEMVKAFTVDGGVDAAVAAGERAVEVAEAGADDVLVASLAGLAHALYHAGELERAWAVALRACHHPEAERRPTAHSLARATLALVALEQGRPVLAHGHAEKARTLLGRVHSSRSWLGANASAARGLVLVGEGQLAEAERELVRAERLFADEVPVLHHAWLLVLLARVRSRRGRLPEAEADLRSAALEVDALPDTGRLPALLGEVQREVDLARSRANGGEVLQQPSDAELLVLRLLASDLSTREIGQELLLSPNTVRTHTRVLYRKLGVNSRAAAVARASALGLVEV
jgi:ATP/maltotriose-dependent transcriptional regulator MalT